MLRFIWSNNWLEYEESDNDILSILWNRYKDRDNGREECPIVRSKGYTYWRGGYTNRDRFIAECYRYIDESTKIINHRAKLMIEKLKVKLDI